MASLGSSAKSSTSLGGSACKDRISNDGYAIGMTHYDTLIYIVICCVFVSIKFCMVMNSDVFCAVCLVYFNDQIRTNPYFCLYHHV